MEELEFRAWDKITNEMIYNIGILTNNCFYYCFIKKEGIYYHPNHKYCVIMQYTGIKDKNRKKIYKGDIVIRNGYSKEVGVIIFENGAFKLRVKRKYNVTYFNDIVYDMSNIEKYNDGRVQTEFPVDFEKIGNKYETPELLEVMK